MKRAKFVVVLSFFVISSFALQNFAQQNHAGTGQVVSSQSGTAQAAPEKGIPPQGVPPQIFGFRDFSKQYQVDQEFLAVPSPARAEQHLKILTALPHVAGSPEDKATADHVAKYFTVAGLETEVVKYSVWMNRPSEISVTVTAPANVKMKGPSPRTR